MFDLHVSCPYLAFNLNQHHVLYYLFIIPYLYIYILYITDDVGFEPT